MSPRRDARPGNGDVVASVDIAVSDTGVRTDRAPALLAVAVAALALVVRLAPFLAPGELTASRHDDDGIMYDAAVRLLHGDLPYRDFVFMHPPAVVVGLIPLAGLADWVGDGTAMAIGRIVMCLLGAASTLMVGLLLRDRGRWAVVAGAGLYATWSTVVVTERTVFLEPLLNAALLGALLLLRGRGARRELLAGVLLGVAVATKAWAVLDVVLLVAWLASTRGWRAAGRLAGAAAGAAALVVLPFFVAAPGPMWQMVVVHQLGRASTAGSIADRLAQASPVVALPKLQERMPGAAFVLAGVLLAVACLLPLVRAARTRRTPRTWGEPVLWGVLALAHGALLLAAPSFYDHYVAWVLAPASLVVGWAVGRAARGAARWAAAAATVVVLAVCAVGSVHNAGVLRYSRAPLVSWAAERQCVWGWAGLVVVADAATPDAERGCDVFVDYYGVGLMHPDGARDDSEVWLTNPAVEALAWAEVGQADGVVLPTGPADQPFASTDDGWWFGPGTRERFLAEFTPEVVVPSTRPGETALTLWTRVAPAD